MSPLSALLLLLLLLIAGAMLLRRSITGGKSHNLPPGPRGLPILGHLHMLGPRPYRNLHRLSLAFGPVMRLRLGLVPAVVVSSPSAARDLLKSHDLAVSGRPHMEAADFIAYRGRGLGLSQYGPYWRGVRKLFTTELLSSHRVESFGPMRREEVQLLVDSLRGSAEAGETVDLTAKLSYLVLDMACRMVLGSKGVAGRDVEEVQGIRWVIQDGSRLLAAFNAADYIPYVGRLDVQGLRRKMRGVKGYTDRFLDKIIAGRLRAAGGSGGQKDFVDILLSYMVDRPKEDEDFQFDSNSVKALIMESIASTLEPIATTLEWALSELLLHPEIMKKVQAEIESVVGKDRMVEEKDLSKLHYLELVLKETLRLHTPLPILIPRRAMEDCSVNGFDIPKNSQIIINAWAIGRDPEAWPEPEKFHPERFIGSNIDVKGHDFELLPFGSGRRGCPGMLLGLTSVRLVLAQLVHCFNWELEDGISPAKLDMEEVFGITAPRAKHLMLVPRYRLQ